MAKATFSGPILAGTVKDQGSTFNLGTAILQQDLVYTVAANVSTYTDADGQNWSYYNKVPAVLFSTTDAGNTTVNSLIIPANSQIVDITCDVVGALTQSSGTVVAKVGYTSGGTEYASFSDFMTGPVTGRVTPTYTNAQALAMMNVGTYTTVYIAITTTTHYVTAGALYFQVKYTQTPA